MLPTGRKSQPQLGDPGSLSPRSLMFGVSARRVLAVLAASVAVTLGMASPAWAVTKISHSSAANQFRNNGVAWTSSGNCSDRYVATCTSFEQINQSTVSGVITLKKYTG